MRRFAALYAELDRTASTLAKREAMATYLRDAPAADAAWAVYVLGGGKLRRLATSTELRRALASSTGYADWLIDASYEKVGDLAETIALMLPAGDGTLADVSLQTWMEQRLPALGRLDSAARIEQLQAWWRALLPAQVFLLNKLITGSLRVGVSHRLVVQAIAQWSEQPTDLIAHRMSGDCRPAAEALQALTAPPGENEHLADRPYPFFLASPLEHEVETLGAAADWLAEWKWDGIRAQLMRRGDSAGLWSRGEERLDGRFPEIERAAFSLCNEAVLDGEVLAWDTTASMPRVFTALQKRIGKLKPGPKLLADAPVRFMAYDVLEVDGTDLRERPLHERRALLATLLEGTDPTLMLSPAIVA
ncbi:MAG: ATP-dependent DNA ligase, partial [Rhodanobacter sp.]